MKRGQKAAQSADVRVCVQDASRPQETLCEVILPGTAPCRCREAAEAQPQQLVLPVINKCDLATPDLLAGLKTVSLPSASFTAPQLVSCTQGLHLGQLVEALTQMVTHLCSRQTAEGPAVSRARHRAHLLRCLESLSAAEVSMGLDEPVLDELGDELVLDF